MAIDEDKRNQLKQFWRKKLLFSLAALGAMAFAAWRMIAVQRQFEQYEVSQSRRLPEKLYNELMERLDRSRAVITPSYSFKALKLNQQAELYLSEYCATIQALSILQDERSILEIGQALEVGENKKKSCYSEFPALDIESSIYGQTVLALGKFQSSTSASVLYQAFERSLNEPANSDWEKLAQKKIERYLPHLPLLQSPQLRTQSATLINALTQTGNNNSVKFLKKILHNSRIDPSLRLSAAYWLQEKANFSDAATSQIFAQRMGEEAISYKPSQQMLNSGDLSAIIALLKHYDIQEQRSMIRKLSATGKQTVAAQLMKMLDESNPIYFLNPNSPGYFKTEIIHAIGQIRHKPAVPKLVTLLKRSEPIIRLLAAEALVNMGDFQTPIPVLAHFLDDEDYFFGMEALRVLSMSRDTQSIVPVL